MTLYTPTKTFPLLIEWKSRARNGLPVQALLGKRFRTAVNHSVAYRRKLVFTKCESMASGVGPASGRAGEASTVSLWHGRYQPGVGNGYLTARIGCRPTDTSGSDGQVYLTVTDVDAASSSDTTAIHIPTQAEDTAPDEMLYYWINYDTSGLTAGTAVEWVLKAVDYARPVSLTIWESGEYPVDTTNGGTAAQDVGVGTDILDDSCKDVRDALWDLWRYNASHLFSWSRNTSSAVEETATSYTNLFDGTTTGGAATTAPGFYLQTTYHDRIKHDVPIVFAVRAAMNNTTGGAARIVDSSNTTLAEITNFTTTPTWQTTTTTLTAGNSLCTIEVKGGSLNSILVDAVAIYEYLA